VGWSTVREKTIAVNTASMAHCDREAGVEPPVAGRSRNDPAAQE
jgi:hypothetical protein